MSTPSRYRVLVDAGLCGSCGREPRDGPQARCVGCREQQRLKSREKRIARGLQPYDKGHNFTLEARQRNGREGGRSSGRIRGAKALDRWTQEAKLMLMELSPALRWTDLVTYVPVLKAMYLRGYQTGYRVGHCHVERRLAREAKAPVQFPDEPIKWDRGYLVPIVSDRIEYAPHEPAKETT